MEMNINVTIDKFGRIILPKPLRQSLGLTTGQQVKIQIVGEGFVAKPIVTTKPILVEENGFLLIKYVDGNGEEEKIEEDYDFDSILKEVRNDRTDDLLKSI